MSTIYYDESRPVCNKDETIGSFFPGKRPQYNFKELIGQLDLYMNWCHIVSYQCIAQAVCNALNVGIARKLGVETENKIEWSEALYGIIASVCGIKWEYGTDTPISQMPDEYVELVANIIDSANCSVYDIDFYNMSEKASELVYCLGKHSDNIRPGNANWNSSIGGAFDPIRKHNGKVTRNKGLIEYINDGAGGYRLYNLQYHTIGECKEVGCTKTALYFYTAIIKNIEMVYSSNLPRSFYCSSTIVKKCNRLIGYKAEFGGKTHSFQILTLL